MGGEFFLIFKHWFTSFWGVDSVYCCVGHSHKCEKCVKAEVSWEKLVLGVDIFRNPRIVCWLVSPKQCQLMCSCSLHCLFFGTAPRSIKDYFFWACMDSPWNRSSRHGERRQVPEVRYGHCTGFTLAFLPLCKSRRVQTANYSWLCFLLRLLCIDMILKFQTKLVRIETIGTTITCQAFILSQTEFFHHYE